MPACVTRISSTSPRSPDSARVFMSSSRTALKGCLSFHSGCKGAMALTRSSAKASWTYIGCSHHSVPSLSKVAMRCSAGTKSGPPCVVTRATKLTIDVFVGPSFHDGNASACASADMGRIGPIRTGSEARVESRIRRLTPKEACGVDMVGSLHSKERNDHGSFQSGRPIHRPSAMTIIKSLLTRCRPGSLYFRFHRIEIEARASLHRRKLDRSHRQFFHHLLNKHEAPEFIFEPVEVLLRTEFGLAIGPPRALERIEAKVSQVRHVRFGLFAEPAARLVDETILEVVDAHGTQFAFAEVPDFVPVRRSLAGDHVHLVIAVQMALEGRVTDLLALLQLLCNVRVTGRRQEGGKPVQSGNDTVLDLAGRHLARPTDHAGYAEATFHDGAFALRKRRLSAIRPGKDLGAVVGGEDHDGVVVNAHLLELVHHDADVVIELRHACFMYRPAVPGVSQGLVFGREVGDDVHPGWIEPQEERLVVGLGLLDELQGKIANFVIYGFHPLGIKRSGILDPLFADLAPAWIHSGVVDGGRVGMEHVARTDGVQQLLRVVRMRGVFHRVEVIEVTEELVEAVHRRKEFVLVAKVILAKLAGSVPHSLQRGGNRHRLRGYPDGCAGLADRGHAGADRQLTGDEVGAARRATRLGVVVGE